MPTSYWNSTQAFIPYYIGFIRWSFFIILKFIPCIFYKQYTVKMIDYEKRKEFRHNQNVKDYYKTDLFESPRYTVNDISVVIPVYQPPPSFRQNIISITKNKPYEVIIVADITCYDEILKQVINIEGNISVYAETRPGKRSAMEAGLKKTTTRLICYTDDDVDWCPNFLYNLIIPFNHKNIAGVGSKQIMRSADHTRSPNLFEIMADMRLSIRYIENKSMTVVDKGASCISGRTACYKTAVIQNEDFYYKFLNEKFFGMQLQSGDDKFITRYILFHGYKTYHQLNDNCNLTTTFESGTKHFKQMLRWSRNTWRSDITLLFIDRKIWKHNTYSAFIIFDKLFTPLYMLYGIFIIPVYTIIQRDYVIFLGWLIWLVFSRGLKLIHHFYRKPKDIIYLPIYILYQYFIVFIRLYALMSLSNRKWGNRAIDVVDGKVVRTGENANLNIDKLVEDIENNEEIISDYNSDGGYDADNEKGLRTIKI